MDAIRLASAFCFYAIGTVVLALIVLVQRNPASPFFINALNILDLPLLLAGTLLAGSSLYLSVTRGKSSPVLLICIFLPLLTIFGFLAYLNFAMPMPAIDAF